MATFKPVVFTAKNHIKSDGTTNIKIRVYHNDKSQYIATNYYIPPKYLSKSGSISNSYPNADLLNYDLSEIIQQYRGVCMKLGTDRCLRMSCIELKEQIVFSTQQKSEYIDFISFSNEVISSTKKEKTAKWYQTAVNSLCRFYNRKEIDIRDITSNRLNKYIESLYDDDFEPGAISNYLRAIRALFNKAKLKYNNEDYDIIVIPNNPFKKVEIPKYKRKRKSIQIDAIKKIRDNDFSTERAMLARDMFMIMFYLMGINIGDLFRLTKTKSNRIEYERSKTNTDDNIYMFPLSIKIEPELKVLIDKYSTSGFLSDVKIRYSNIENFTRAINTGLKQMCEELKIEKITTNWARHSWASIARNKAHISKADIDFCLGHVNNDYKMADIYIDIDYSIYDEANRKVLDLLK